MVMERRIGGQQLHTFARESTDYNFEFTGANPTADLSQDEAVVASVTYTSDGLYAVVLNQRFQAIYGVANCQKAAADWFASVTDVVDGGAAANTFNVRVTNGGAAANPAAKVNVRLTLVTAGHGRVTT